ncbi:hypothetical protein [Micrococcus luteus]|uniref:hypothetical protein n=1 Tax=Micrococcus luteus TaxID=1270 RepID=UPI0019D0243F|nr:hypothetical protein [Micrococcus luteus]MBN6750433.1 hypothetical protein [Micrococcus luteus]MBN6760737.1 hypothetical protein [Micrococcus luteus]MBN6800710.1 hypothetical protein [Micrococcus luteus]
MISGITRTRLMLVVAVGLVDEGVKEMTDSMDIIKQLCAENERLLQEVKRLQGLIEPIDVRTTMSPAHRVVLQMLSEGKAQIRAAEASGLSTATVSRMAHRYADLIEVMKNKE